MDYQVSEQAVLAACLADDTGRSSATAVERLTEDDFTIPFHQKIFKLIASSSEPINEIDVAIELPEFRVEAMELAEKHGGGKVDRYVEQVENTRNRRIAEHSIHHAMDLLKQERSAEEIASVFNSKVAKALTKGSGQVKCGKAANEAYSEFLAIDAGDSSAISTSFSKIDYALSGGFQPGKLYVLAARPGIGKSALAIHFSHEIAKRGYRVAYASLEMSAAECAGRLLSRESGVSRPRQKGDLLPAHKQKLQDAARRMKNWNITFKDDAESTLDSFRLSRPGASEGRCRTGGNRLSSTPFRSRLQVKGGRSNLHFSRAKEDFSSVRSSGPRPFSTKQRIGKAKPQTHAFRFTGFGKY